MPRLTKATLQKHLNHLEKEELVEHLLTLFQQVQGRE
jgi:predicted ArsR family transcriptional regulator